MKCVVWSFPEYSKFFQCLATLFVLDDQLMSLKYHLKLLCIEAFTVLSHTGPRRGFMAPGQDKR